MASSGRITLSEIARRAETSTMAVSVVLNNARSNTRVSEATRRRILTIAADLNYTPNAMARGLKRQRTNTLGVLFNWAGSHAIHNLYSVAVLDGLVDGAAKAGYHILIYTESWRTAAISSATFSDQRVDGLVVIAPREDSDIVPSLSALGIPLTLISSATEVSGVPYVTIDNRSGITLALNHLHELGHTRIAYAGHGLERHNMRERHDMYRLWMAQHNLPVAEEHVLAHLRAGDSGSNAKVLEAFLSHPNRSTALFAANDDLAAEVLDAARCVGVSVPDEFSVIGFDDVLVASLTVPKLTTIRQPLFEMGKLAARLLAGRIEGDREVTANPAHVIQPELIMRGSTAPAQS